MLMEDSQSLASKAIGTLLIPVSSLISGSMAMPAKFERLHSSQSLMFRLYSFPDITILIILALFWSQLNTAVDQRMGYVVDDILDTILEGQFKLVMDKGTLDAIGLHPDGPVKRVMYWWDSVSELVAPGGMLVIASLTRE
ncbi:hypothetical protein DY000_02053378 [Brassica cretica]|uniref:Uncharacterized protein n=1 Tax=Brassica cretica TaxID=69181 RepID=A0ABQ7A4J9_BRACR|nr:hypothetical protein DY000_02053378 [Brassica cretica]